MYILKHKLHLTKHSNRVKLYIQYGWDKYLVDPDHGINSQRKLATTRGSSSTCIRLMKSVPAPEDILWTNRLYNLPGITFGTIYDHLIDRKVVLKKISYLENIADERAEAVLQHASGDHECSNSTSIDYTRTLDKAYRFYQDGHIQKIKYHPLPQVPDHSCVSAAVLPSMKKDRVYKVIIFFVNPQLVWHKLAVHAQQVCQDVVTMLQAPFIAWKIISTLGCRMMNGRDVLNVCRPGIVLDKETLKQCQSMIYVLSEKSMV